MRTTRGAKRLIPLLALLLFFPLAIAGCDAGDGGGDPTGPSTQYVPGMDFPGASLTATATPSTVAPGERVGILATFRDANGVPVQGVGVGVYPEAGTASAPYFSYETNPTLTDSSGTASIGVWVSAGCPRGSYTLVVQTFPGAPSDAAFTKAYVHIRVAGTGTGAVLSVTLSGPATLTLSGASVSGAYQADVVAAGCTPEIAFQFGSGWILDADGDGFYTNDFTAEGSYIVQARARCGASAWVTSDTVTTVVAAP